MFNGLRDAFRPNQSWSYRWFRLKEATIYRIEPWFADGFLYACILIAGIITFAHLATNYARAFLGAT